ncbi:hypothetical protein NKR19_g4616 [Coniochaeta hoffmannii]|uniref:Uncharacterized protein n=1 Tax=Coniochaeta hoffmannii TaxID=91930 RepID=A0AA38S1Y7_9PEZI|nr:hypothetical protein NKR19_g4616 [Coniochaeta hoffmannii]
MSHDAITLHQSFGTPFLLLSNHGAHLQRIASLDRADTTMVTPPPRIWFPIHENQYAEMADHQLKKKDIARALSRSYLPSPESPLSLASESDIVRASALYFLHPVIKAMQAVIPGTSCSAEVVETGVRCDVLITVSNVPVAVLEYKNRGYLARRDFTAGCVADSTERNKPEIINRLALAGKRGKPGFLTTLDGNSVILTKQAGAYATRFLTKYVAIFDWDSLFLWYFAGMKIVDSNKSVHGDWAYGTWVERRDMFRIVLLGFFLKAYYAKKEKGPRYNERAWDPWVPTPAEQERRRQEFEAKQREKMGSKNVDAYGRRW